MSGTAQPGSPKKEWAAGGAKGTPWSVGANTWARPQYSSSAYQKDQPRPVTNSARMFDESPNGTSLPMTYAPGPNTKRQFSKQGFEGSSEKEQHYAAANPHKSNINLAHPSPPVAVRAPWGTDMDCQRTERKLEHAAPPQGWQGQYDSSLHCRRNTNAASGERVNDKESVQQLLSLDDPVERPTNWTNQDPAHASYGGQVQDWAQNMDSNLSSRRQMRAQGYDGNDC